MPTKWITIMFHNHFDSKFYKFLAKMRISHYKCNASIWASKISFHIFLKKIFLNFFHAVSMGQKFNVICDKNQFFSSLIFVADVKFRGALRYPLLLNELCWYRKYISFLLFIFSWLIFSLKISYGFVLKSSANQCNV